MRMHDGASRPAYNIQTATDTENHFITEFEVTSQSNDVGRIYDTADAARKILGVETIVTIMDKGYESGKDIENVCFPASSRMLGSSMIVKTV